MEVLLGGLSSLLYGVADFLGGEGARKASAATVVVWSGIFSFPVLAVAALIVGGEATASDYWLGLAAGMAGGVGLVLLFTGLALGRAAAVAPLAAAVGAVVPVAVAVIIGDRPSFLAWIGVAVAVPAIALSAWSDDDSGSLRTGLTFGAGAGVSFGGFAAIIGLTGDGSGLLPLIPARGALILVVVGLGLAGVWKVGRFGSSPRKIILANGALDVTANVMLLLALRAGSFALGAVAASFYPAVTVLMARTINGEGLRKRQISGILLTLAALTLIAIS